MRFLPDEPISSHLQDVLGLSDFVELVQTSIYNTEPPFVYGLLGDWGSGKTSAMQLLRARLENDLQNNAHVFVPIWFNAWKYENEANIIYPLLHAIKRDYSTRVGPVDQAKDFGRKFVEVVTTSTLALTDLLLRFATKQATGEAMKLSEVSEQLQAVQNHPSQLEDVLGRWAAEIDGLHQAFLELVETYATDLALIHREIRKDDVRFVIFIDDLDRCLPETTISILESIKNFLTVNRCIFVFGLNPVVIYQGIRIKYHGLEINGREYLEKILNYSFYIPEPEVNRIANFATDQITNLVLDKQLQDNLVDHFREFGEVVHESKFNNPRRIKRILNRYLFFLGKNSDSLDQFYNLNIIRLIIIAEYFPQIFQLLIKESGPVLSMIEKAGTSDFDFTGFEQKFGVSVANIYPQLSRMAKLFSLIKPTDKTKIDISNHVQAVFNITRLV